MINATGLLYWVLQLGQTASSSTGLITGGPPPGFSWMKAATELIQFVGYFLAIGAVGFRFGVVRRTRGISDEAKAILSADKAALFGVIGVLLIGLALIGGPFANAVTHNKTFVESLPKNLAPLEFKLAMLALALLGFVLVRVTSSIGWALAAVGILFAVLQPIYTGKFAGKVNAVHILAASTWLGTLLVLAVVGIRGVTRSGTVDRQRTMLISDLVNSFSPLALTAATVVGITGLTTAWLHLKRVSSLWTTGYGVMLVVKLILVAMVVALGAWNWKRVRPSLGDEGSELIIRRSATLELTFAALVLLATSVLVTLPSPK
jgi:putative copper export protein